MESDMIEEDVEPEASQNERSRPALTINIQSWATPIVGLVMLVAGLLLGYYSRPFLAERLGEPEEPSGNPQAAAPAGESLAPTPDIQSREELMTFLVENTEHFLGDPNAAVTMIEFSDFQ